MLLQANLDAVTSSTSDPFGLHTRINHWETYGENTTAATVPRIRRAFGDVQGRIANGCIGWRRQDLKKRSNVWHFDELNIGFPLVFNGFSWVFHGLPSPVV